MEIVHIFHSYYPTLGGIERAMERLAREQMRLGHRVHVITSFYGAEDRSKEEKLNGVFVHRVKGWRLHYPDLTIPREIPRDILERVDVVLCWTQASFFPYRLCKEAKKLGKPIVTYFIGVDYLERHYNPLIRLFGYSYQKWVTRKIVKITDLALVTNNWERRLLKERYGIDAIVLPHGVDEVYLKLTNIARYFREKYGIDGRIIAYIGRIHPTKGLDLLIRAFAKIARHSPGVVLVIAGKGDEKYLKKCMELAERLEMKNKIRYLGYITEEDKIAFIDASEVVVLPSIHAGESYPLIIDEVKARRKPLVVTSYGALPLRVKNLVEGVVVNADANSLAEGIRCVLDNIDSFKIVETPRTWSSIAKELTEILEKVARS